MIKKIEWNVSGRVFQLTNKDGDSLLENGQMLLQERKNKEWISILILEPNVSHALLDILAAGLIKFHLDAKE